MPRFATAYRLISAVIITFMMAMTHISVSEARDLQDNLKERAIALAQKLERNEQIPEGNVPAGFSGFDQQQINKSRQILFLLTAFEDAYWKESEDQ